MSDHAKKEVELFGKKRTFHADTGVVLNANQRSDTYVSGSGNSSSVAGYGGGSTSISSVVVVTSDIWIRDASGKELRLRFNRDVPVREGNIVHAVYVAEAGSNDALDNLYVMFYNGTTRECFRPRKEVGKTLLKDTAPAYLLTFLITMVVSAVIGVSTIRGHDIGSSLLGMFFGFLGWCFYAAVSGETKKKKAYDTLDQVFKSFIPDLDKATKEFSVPDAQPVAVVNPQPQLAVQQEGGKVFCTNCGKQPTVESAFCGSCGAKLAQAV